MPSLRRLSPQQCRRWMLTGEAFDVDTAIRNGFVDLAVPSQESARECLEDILQGFAATPVDQLRALKRMSAMKGDVAVALTETGTQCLLPVMQEPMEIKLVRMHWVMDGVAELEIGDAAQGNVMTWSLAKALRSVLGDLKNSFDEGKLSAVLVRAAGDNFSLGGDPSSWIAEAAGA